MLFMMGKMPPNKLYVKKTLKFQVLRVLIKKMQEDTTNKTVNPQI